MCKCPLCLFVFVYWFAFLHLQKIVDVLQFCAWMQRMNLEWIPSNSNVSMCVCLCTLFFFFLFAPRISPNVNLFEMHHHPDSITKWILIAFVPEKEMLWKFPNVSLFSVCNFLPVFFLCSFLCMCTTCPPMMWLGISVCLK